MTCCNRTGDKDTVKGIILFKDHIYWRQAIWEVTQRGKLLGQFVDWLLIQKAKHLIKCCMASHCLGEEEIISI